MLAEYGKPRLVTQAITENITVIPRNLTTSAAKFLLTCRNPACIISIYIKYMYRQMKCFLTWSYQLTTGFHKMKD